MSNFPGPTLIPCPMSITDSRVVLSDLTDLYSSDKSRYKKLLLKKESHFKKDCSKNQNFRKEIDTRFDSTKKKFPMKNLKSITFLLTDH